MPESDRGSDSGPLLTTSQAAKAIGISTRALVRYSERGYVTPAMVLPSGHRRWNLAELRRQLRELPPRGEREV